jgi:hypothetical protein
MALAAPQLPSDLRASRLAGADHVALIAGGCEQPQARRLSEGTAVRQIDPHARHGDTQMLLQPVLPSQVASLGLYQCDLLYRRRLPGDIRDAMTDRGGGPGAATGRIPGSLRQLPWPFPARPE